LIDPPGYEYGPLIDPSLPIKRKSTRLVRVLFREQRRKGDPPKRASLCGYE
jgi:hypothetical protein